MTPIETYYNELIADTLWMETLKYVHKGKDIEQGIKEALMHLIADPERLEKATLSDRKKLVNSWMSTKRFPRENVVKENPSDRFKRLRK